MVLHYDEVMPVSKGRNQANKRPTPPSHKPKAIDTKGPSRTWYVVTMFSLMGVGVLIILANYIGFFGATSNTYLLIGLAAIGVGFTMTMDYR